jgi:putative SOS response-associated peptidase YedK
LHLLPSQLLYVIRENHETSERTLELLRWGLIPHGCKDAEGGRKPINARAESVAQLPYLPRGLCKTSLHCARRLFF